MLSSRQKSLKVLALFLMFCTSKCFAQTAWSIPISGDPAVPQRPLLGRLMTRNDRAILVNGASASSNDTIVTGSSIETPDKVGATVTLGSLGAVEIAPYTMARLDYDVGKLSVMLVRGCLIVHAKKKTTGSVETSAGRIANTDPSNDGKLDVCLPIGAPNPTVNQGAAARAGAGAKQPNLAWSITRDDMVVKLLVLAGAVAVIITGVVLVDGPGQGTNPSPTQ